jgi:hypothetical protein
MEFPQEIQNIINEYAKPCTRPDWKEGCYFSRQPFYFFVTYGELIEELVNEFNDNNNDGDETDYSDDDSEYTTFSDYEIEDDI